MTTLAIVGSRSLGARVRPALYDLVAGSQPDTCIVSGGAVGVDTEVARAARFYRRSVEILYPEWRKYGRTAGYVRNAAIVARVRVRGGYVVAFWDGDSAGTRDTIGRARMAGVAVETVVCA